VWSKDDQCGARGSGFRAKKLELPLIDRSYKLVDYRVITGSDVLKASLEEEVDACCPWDEVQEVGSAEHIPSPRTRIEGGCCFPHLIQWLPRLQGQPSGMQRDERFAKRRR
jgi:hypothetical protein